MTDFDNRGQISLWSNREGLEKNPKSPRWKGHFYAHKAIAEGEKIEVSLWANESDTSNAPVMKGKIKDAFVPDESRQSAQPSQPADPQDDESDIPF